MASLEGALPYGQRAPETLALTEQSCRPFAQFMQAAVLAPVRMSNSTFDQPLTVGDNPNAALAHDDQGRRMEPPWQLYPEQSAAGLWTTPTDLAKFIVEIQTAVRGASGKLLNRRSATEMLAPVGIGRFGLGLVIEQRDDGWYFSHSADNWGYRAWMTGRMRKGNEVVIMANGDNGMALINQVADRIGNPPHTLAFSINTTVTFE